MTGNTIRLWVALVSIVLVAVVGTAIDGWLPGLIPAWRLFLIVAGVVLIALLGMPIIRNGYQRRLRKP